jgi:DNA-binding response OmpR family regulator
MGERVLIVEDEAKLAGLLRDYLAQDGFEASVLHRGDEVEPWVSTHDVDLVLLDLMLPGKNGLEVCKALRASSGVAIIMVTARVEEIDRLLGLELGADDYITKPFSIREFRSRIRAVLRRAGLRAERAADGAIEVGSIAIDPVKRAVTVDGERAQLTYVEFEVLHTLASHPGRVYSRQALLEAVWGDSAYREPRTIDVHIRHLREKIEADPREPAYIFTVRGVGYRFRDTMT